MSGFGDKTADSPERDAMARLEVAVSRMLEEHTRLRGRLRTSEVRLHELEALLRSFHDGSSDPAALQQRILHLEAQNEVLSNRIEEGRAGVERLLARVRFFEEQR